MSIVILEFWVFISVIFIFILSQDNSVIQFLYYYMSDDDIL